jgi:anaerobic selenocysteine-containing dehydrogenase
MKLKRIGGSKYRLSSTIQPGDFIDTALSGKPYPVKAMFIMGTNLLLSHSDCRRMLEALRKIDFIVAADLFMTPTTQFADILLPAASWPECNDIPDLHMVWCVTARVKVDNIGECRDDKEIIFDLAHRMGLEKDFPWRDTEEYCNWMLRETGLTFEEFKKAGILKGEMRYRKYEENGFKTPSGKFELYCAALEEMGYDPLPGYREPPESPYSTPDICRDYPLVITTGARVQPFFHTEGRQIESLRRLHPDPMVEIHPDTAKKYDISQGGWVWIESPRGGKIRQRAVLNPGIDPRVVSAQHGWWFPEKEPWDYDFEISNVNMLTHGMPRDPQTGAEPWRSFLCRISRAE